MYRGASRGWCHAARYGVPYLLLAVFLAGLHCPPAQAARSLPAGAVADLARRIDVVVPTQLFLNEIPGAVVALVGNGRVLHLGGYGYADRDTQQPVRADRTLFGTGSVSKLFTWTAVMQLVEQDRLDPGRDVNDYLRGVRIPATWPEPVTLARLLTHTAGFEERSFGFYARSPAALTTLPTFLAEHMPARVFPPGRVSAYSNYGAALAGQIVAEASGMPFERYIETRILEPLGMRHSSFRQPLPPALAADLATGYRDADGRGGQDWYQARPSGALRATAADMARFLLAQLQQGRVGNARILKPESIAAMQRRQFGNHPAVSGLTYGFQELRRGGRRILWQPGDTRHFTAAVYLLPEAGIGLFVAHNRAGTRAQQTELLDTLLAWLQPFGPPPAPLPAAGADAPDADLTGSYRSSRSGVVGLERLVAPFRTVRVRADAPGRLHITGLSMVRDAVWTEQAPGVYRDADSGEIVVFDRDADGGTWLFEGNVPAYGYAKLPWHATPAVQGTLLGVCVLVFLVGAFIRPPYAGHAPSAPRPLAARLARPVAGALCATNLAFLAGLALVLAQGQQLLYGVPPFVHAILLVPPVSAALTVTTAVLAAGAWRRGYRSTAAGWYYALVLLAALLFLGLLRYWRLV